MFLFFSQRSKDQGKGKSSLPGEENSLISDLEDKIKKCQAKIDGLRVEVGDAIDKDEKDHIYSLISTEAKYLNNLEAKKDKAAEDRDREKQKKNLQNDFDTESQRLDAAMKSKAELAKKDAQEKMLSNRIAENYMAAARDKDPIFVELGKFLIHLNGEIPGYFFLFSITNKTHCQQIIFVS